MKQLNNGTMEQWNNGFTLLEAIVVVAIIGLIAVFVVANFQSNRNKHQLIEASQELSLNIRKAQNMAISGKVPAQGDPLGYGVYTKSNNKYVIFYNLVEDTIEPKYVSNTSIILETINLPAQMNLSPNSQSVFFLPPDPETYINGVAIGSLTFTLSINGLSKTVIVDASGKIEVE